MCRIYYAPGVGVGVSVGVVEVGVGVVVGVIGVAVGVGVAHAELKESHCCCVVLKCLPSGPTQSTVGDTFGFAV